MALRRSPTPDLPTRGATWQVRTVDCCNFAGDTQAAFRSGENVVGSCVFDGTYADVPFSTTFP